MSEVNHTKPLLENMMKHLISAVGLGLLFATTAITASAEEINTKTDLKTYLEKYLGAGKTVNHAPYIGEKFWVARSGSSCLGSQTIKQFPLISRILLENKLMEVEVIQKKTTIHYVTNCLFAITSFKFDQLVKLGAKKTEYNGVKGISIPLAKQDFLGIEGVNLRGGVSISGTECDISFTPWFRNYEPSKFVQKFRASFEKDRTYKKIFNNETKTSMWCFGKKYDDSLEWKIWSRY